MMAKRIELTLTIVSVLVLLGCTSVYAPTSDPIASDSVSEIAKDWSVIAPLGIPRTAVAVEVLEGKIYVIGGLDNLGRSSSKVEVYDPLTKKWDEASPLPKALHHAASATISRSVGDRLYVFGGFEGRRSKPSNSAYEYNAQLDSWIARTSIPVARGALAASEFGDLVYVFGGVDGDSVSSRIDVYDPSSDSWSVGPQMRTPRSHFSVVTLRSLMYVIGGKGLNGGASLGLIEILDPVTGGWATTQDLDIPRSNMGALAIFGRLYVAGGEDIEKGLSSVEVFNPDIATWIPFGSLPTPVRSGGLAAINQHIFYVGGSGGAFLEDVNYTVVLD